nr:DUF4097 family beta strand repeat-containing protein [uncultured Holophaga sp.]
MRLRRLSVATLGMLLMGTSGMVVSAQEERQEIRTAPLAGGANLRVTNRNGHIRVGIWDRDLVEVKAAIRDTASRRITLSLREAGGGLELLVQEGSGDWLRLAASRSPRCQLDIKVPRRLNASFRTLNGDVEVQGIEGFAECETTNGDIRVRQLKGEVHCETTNGGIEAVGLQARLKAETTHGSIRLQGVAGGIRAETTHGDVEAEQLDGWGEGIQLETTQGDIRVVLGRATGHLHAETTVGSLDIRPAQGGGMQIQEGHEVQMKIGEGRQPIRLETTHGSIRVR